MDRPEKRFLGRFFCFWRAGTSAYLRSREGTNKEESMGKWEPLFWILAAGVGFIVFLIGLESLKMKRRKK